MPQKKKVGKERLDKYYHLAKDQGYRARSSFKLIQLAKKHDFLSKAQVCLDLCAAPGGWSQVAQRNMPRDSQIIAIDLVPIKPIMGVVCMISDITTDKCRSMIRKELGSKKADVVLHDGAPNVGANWSKDAYGQNELTLHAMKLACDTLKPGGTFVTKVFRSADYNSLLWVFGQLFDKVDATKPTASRNVSAEIFVTCLKFRGGKIDPRFYDPKWVFMETVEPLSINVNGMRPSAALNTLIKYAPKKHRQGYEEGDNFKIQPAEDFFAVETPAEMLMVTHKIDLEGDANQLAREHVETTQEVVEYCADLKVLGKRELSVLLKWRAKVLQARDRAERAARKEQERMQQLAVREQDKAHKDKKKADKAGVPSAVDDAIGDILGSAKQPERPGAAAAKKASGADASDDDESSDEEHQIVDEDLEKDMVDEIEKKRMERKREKKKTSERQKKRDWKKKMSLGNTKQLKDEPELFRISQKNIEALKDQDKYLDPREVLESEPESDSVKSFKADDPTDSDDDGLDRHMRMEVDLAVNHQLKKMAVEDKFRTSQQRKRKKKKETRREQVMSAWATEAGSHAQGIERKAADDYALKDKDSDDENDSDEDEAANFRLKLMRAAQEADYKGGLDGVALEALAFGVNQPKEAQALLDEEDAGGEAPGEQETALAIPEDDDDEPGEGETKAEHRMARWFSQDIFSTVETRASGGELAMSKADERAMLMRPLDRDSDDEEDKEEGNSAMKEYADHELPQLPLTDKARRKLKRKREEDRRLGKKKGEIDPDAGPMEVAPLEAPKPLVSKDNKVLKPSDPNELAETLALGSILVSSKKNRMDLIDAAYNRYTADPDECLPDWFTEEEERYNKPELPVSRELMDQFRKKLREINARPIKKVAEARARKKKRLYKRLEDLRSTATSMMDSPDMSEMAKARQMKKELRKLAKNDERKVSVVAIKKSGGGYTKGNKIPKGAKVKVVDRRLKADIRGKKKADARNKKRAKAVNRKHSMKQEVKQNTRRRSGGINKIKMPKGQKIGVN